MCRNAYSLVVIVGLVSIAGCYRYVPAPPSEVEPGERVRAHLSRDGSERVGGVIGPDMLTVDGQLLHRDDGGIELVVERTARIEGFPSTNLTETLRLEPSHIRLMERRELDGMRTAGFIGLVVAGSVAAVLGTQTVGGPNDPEPEDEGGLDDPSLPTITWFRLPLPGLR